MGKGIRSKTKKHFRTIKREEVFKPVEEARLARLTAAQLQSTLSQNEQIKLLNPADTTSTTTDADLADTTETMDEDKPKLSKAEREKIMANRNQYKRIKRSQSKARGKAHGLHDASAAFKTKKGRRK
ncbi:hypothetical protein HDU97_002170 [Phlyctochytrium planicorne]|nr:hypothetical protein HDU97_002170 [Phlyctochytrium planicorne]